MFQLLICLLFLNPSLRADDLLNVLDGETTQIDGLSIEKKSSIFKSLVASPNAEQNIFFQFLEKNETQKALYQWPSAFEETAFSRSDDGVALYSYLLYKNGLELTGLENLFAANPVKVNKKLIDLWRGLMQTNEILWTRADIRWTSQWTDVFGLPAEVTVTARRFDEELSIPKIEELLRKTTSNTWERSWTEWRFVTSLLMQSEDIKAAKLLKHLQSVTSNNPVSQNLMNLTAARMLYQNGYLNEAIRYYSRIEKASDYWFEALEERGWAELRLGQPQNTLAQTQTLLVSALEPDVGPEVFYLASLANLKVCDYQEVSKVLAEFRSRFRTKAAQLIELKEKPEGKATEKLFSLLAKNRVSMPELGGLGKALPRHSTRDENLFFLVQRNDLLSKEAEIAKKLYSQSLADGTALVGFQAKMEKFKETLLSRSRNSYTSALNRVTELARLEIDEISNILKKMQIVEAELIQQLALSDRVIEDTKNLKEKKKKGTTGSQDPYALQFPFQGEVWFDELNQYKIDIAKGCQSDKGKAL